MKAYYFVFFFLLSFFYAGHRLQAQSVSPAAYYSMQNWDTSPYKSYRFESAKRAGEFINFRMLFPNGYDSSATDTESYPLLIVLHGAGESARMEWDNGSKTNTPYPEDDPRYENNDHHLFYGGQEHLKAVKSDRFPGFVVFPQNFYGTWVKDKGSANSGLHRDLEKALELVDHLASELNVDPRRIYIQGLSNGGAGTWYAAYSRPNLFAAALPMSSPGDPAMARELTNTRLWVFQGADDPSPRASETRKTIDAIQDAGGSVRYTEYPETGHNTWNKAYREEDYFEWILNQQRGEPTNQWPTVSGGNDQTLTLPTNSTSLKATASDPDGSIASYLWEKLSGPAATLKNAETATLSLSDLVEGVYTFRIKVIDNKGASATDEVDLKVNSKSNRAPAVNAGADQSLVLPENSTSFTASASDSDGTIASYEWVKLNGPAATLSNAQTATLALSDLMEGEYTFQVKVKDDQGAEATDEVGLRVYSTAPANLPPGVNAGDDQVINLPDNTTSFTATASDPDGTISSWLWEQQSGPETTMSGTGSPTLELKELQAGEYLFRLTVTDNGGASATDEVALQVLLTSGIDGEDIVRLIQLKAYPNPFKKVVYLQAEAPQPEPLLITVLNAYGATIYQQHALSRFPGEKPLRIDMSAPHFLPGLYFIQVRDKKGRYKETLTLIKQ
jgi:predicted peptidase